MVTVEGKKGKTRKKRQPWMTGELFLLIDKKSQAYQRYRQQRNDSTLKADFKLISAELKKEIRKAKVKYYSELLDENYLDSKKCWNIINNARGKNVREDIKNIEIEGEVISVENNAEKVVEEFNKFFNSITEKLLKKEGMEKRDSERGCNTSNNVSQGYVPTLDGFRLTVGDVERAIKNLKNRASV